MSTQMVGRESLQRLLVPLDGSHLAECVLPAAISLGVRLNARVILLHVMERAAPPVIHGDRHLTETGRAEEYLSEIASRYAIRPVEIERHVHPNLEGDVAKSIIEHEIALRADLVVLSTHGRGDARRVLLGSVAQQVLRRGARPVLLIRPADPSSPAVAEGFELGRIVVPLDGAAPSEVVLPLSVTFASAWGAEMVLMQVVPTLATVSGERAGVARFTPAATAASLEMEEAAAEKYLKTVAVQFQTSGVPVSVSVARGDPAQEILDTARRSGAGMIAMATHGRAGLDALVSGSVASRVAAKYPHPILLVRS
jgi:nucleotide-binding universal stress UspA family protein